MQDYYRFVNLPLPYSYVAMEPYIDVQTMYLHHDKHLQTYIDNLNRILKDVPYLQKMSLEELLFYADELPEELRTQIQNNGGGVYNHRFYFNGLSDKGGDKPTGHLITAMERDFGCFEAFRDKFKAAALSVFGSGYAWLVVSGGRLRIITLSNQDTPIPLSVCPVLNIDVWEHAYYLKHQNRRAEYVDDWFHVVNWKRAEENYRLCIEN